MAKRSSVNIGRDTKSGAFVRGLGSLATFAHPARSGSYHSSAKNPVASLRSDWERIGSDLRQVVDRERTGK